MNLYGQVKTPNFRLQADIRKIEQLRDDIVLTATEHDKTIDELAAARERIKVLEDALKPFVKLLQPHNDRKDRDNKTEIFGINGAYITLGDLRFARKALEVKP